MDLQSHRPNLASSNTGGVLKKLRSGQGTDIMLDKLLFGIKYSLYLLPLNVTSPTGALKRSLRIHGLLPESSLPDWVIVLIAPIVPLTMVPAVVSSTPLLGDFMPLVGILLYLLAQMMYVFRRHLYTEILTEGQDQAMECNQRISTVLSCSGVATIGISVWTGGR